MNVTCGVALDALELELHGLAELEVEGGERLVEQERRRLVHQRPGQRDALLLAAGELRGPALGEVAHADDLEHLAHRLGDPRSSGTFRLRSPKATLSNTFMCGNSAYCWNTVFTLRRYGGVRDTSSPSRRMRPSVGASNPAIIRSVVVLPQPDGPEHREELAAPDREVGVVHGDEVAEPLGDVIEHDHRRAGAASPSAVTGSIASNGIGCSTRAIVTESFASGS